MRFGFVVFFILVLGTAVVAQTAKTPILSASACKSVCENGATNSLTSPADKSLFASCWLENFCVKACGDKPCNPVAVDRSPHSTDPLDVLRRMQEERS